MSDETPVDRPQPAGLGGWLWPISWASAVLPVASLASLVATLSGDLFVIFRYGEIPYPLSEPWALRSIGLALLLVLISWWWAIGWFARDPHVIRKSPLLLFGCASLLIAIGWIERDLADYALASGILTGLAATIMISSRWSKRVRNTFTSDFMLKHATTFEGTIMGGPVDWSRGRWILPGALLYAGVALCFEWRVFAEAASQAIPPPLPEPVRREPGNTAEALATLGHPGRYIEASRVALMLSLGAALLIAGAFTAFARGARWTSWILISALAFAMAAPLRMSARDWCCPFLDGPDFELMWRMWCVVLILVIATTGFHGLPRWIRRIRRIVRPSSP